LLLFLLLLLLWDNSLLLSGGERNFFKGLVQDLIEQVRLREEFFQASGGVVVLLVLVQLLTLALDLHN
jgi:hypothetical protein